MRGLPGFEKHNDQNRAMYNETSVKNKKKRSERLKRHIIQESSAIQGGDIQNAVEWAGFGQQDLFTNESKSGTTVLIPPQKKKMATLRNRCIAVHLDPSPFESSWCCLPMGGGMGAARRNATASSTALGGARTE
eukprot:gene10720-7451_t